MLNAGLDEAQPGLNTAGRNISNLRYPDDITVMAKSKEELKSILIKVKGDSRKAGLKLNFKKRTAWHPVPSLHGKQMSKQWKQCQTLFFGAPKSLQMVTAIMKLKDTCSLEEKL